MTVYILASNRNHVHLGQVTTPTTLNTRQTLQCYVRHTTSPPQYPVQLWISAVNSRPPLLVVLQLPFHSLSPKPCCAAGPSITPPVFALLYTTAGLCHCQRRHNQPKWQQAKFSACRLLVSIAGFAERNCMSYTFRVTCGLSSGAVAANNSHQHPPPFRQPFCHTLHYELQHYTRPMMSFMCASPKAASSLRIPLSWA